MVATIAPGAVRAGHADLERAHRRYARHSARPSDDGTSDSEADPDSPSAPGVTAAPPNGAMPRPGTSDFAASVIAGGMPQHSGWPPEYRADSGSLTERTARIKDLLV